MKSIFLEAVPTDDLLCDPRENTVDYFSKSWCCFIARYWILSIWLFLAETAGSL